mmetsp:Transcript_7714/g.32789  ORF Transcript_7714/g.32789 Transcript_7714/m.32789 type:complete len:363 (+) Transcript_7714:1792-2880(+)
MSAVRSFAVRARRRLDGVPALARSTLPVLAHFAVFPDRLAPRSAPALAARAHAPGLAHLLAHSALGGEALLPLVPPPSARAVLRPLVRPLDGLRSRTSLVRLLAPLFPPRLDALSSGLLHGPLRGAGSLELLPPLFVPLLPGRVASPLIRAPLDALRLVVVAGGARRRRRGRNRPRRRSSRPVHLPPRFPPGVPFLVEAAQLRAEFFVPARVRLLPVRLAVFPDPVAAGAALHGPAASVPVVALVDAALEEVRVPLRVHLVALLSLEVDAHVPLALDAGVALGRARRAGRRARPIGRAVGRGPLRLGGPALRSRDGRARRLELIRAFKVVLEAVLHLRESARAASRGGARASRDPGNEARRG